MRKNIYASGIRRLDSREPSEEGGRLSLPLLRRQNDTARGTWLPRAASKGAPRAILGATWVLILGPCLYLCAHYERVSVAESPERTRCPATHSTTASADGTRKPTGTVFDAATTWWS